MDRARCSRPTGTSRRHKDDDSSLDDGEGSSSGTAGTALISRPCLSGPAARQLPAIVRAWEYTRTYSGIGYRIHI